MARRAEDVRKGPATTAEAALLYDRDFYAWTQEQAQALRSHFRGDNRIDVEHLAEEIEDLGASELKALESQVVNILAHFLKLDYSSLDWPRNHWRQEIFAFRNVLQRRLTGSLKRLILQDFDELYASARESAAVALIESEPGLIRRLPKDNPYDWAALESRHDLRSLLAEQEAAATRRNVAGRGRPDGGARVRSGGDRRRAGGLRRRDPGGAARHAHRAGRARASGRHLPQLGLHPDQGAAARGRDLPPDAQHRRLRLQRQGVELRFRQSDQALAPGRRPAQPRRAASPEEE